MPLPRPKQFKPVYGRRAFELDLSDHVKDIWDNTIPIVQQCSIECVGVQEQKLSSVDEMRAMAQDLVTHLKLHVTKELIEEFDPGPTLVFILSESHLAVHTWPEKGYIHIDLVTCSRQGIEMNLVTDVIGNRLEPSSIRANLIRY